MGICNAKVQGEVVDRLDLVVGQAQLERLGPLDLCAPVSHHSMTVQVISASFLFPLAANAHIKPCRSETMHLSREQGWQ